MQKEEKHKWVVGIRSDVTFLVKRKDFDNFDSAISYLKELVKEYKEGIETGEYSWEVDEVVFAATE